MKMAMAGEEDEDISGAIGNTKVLYSNLREQRLYMYRGIYSMAHCMSGVIKSSQKTGYHYVRFTDDC